MADVKENWERIQESLGSRAGDVTVVAVTKRQPIENVRAALDCGVKALGVNYAQDGDKLRESLGTVTADWHFIGHIQSRKAKLLTGYDLVESLDRLSVAEELNKRAKEKLRVLVQVNIGSEPQKSGVLPENVESTLKEMAALEKLQIAGLMAMPPALEVEERRPYFVAMRKLFEAHREACGMEVLSMGTSQDYVVAVEEGATHVRLGEVLLGYRPAP